MQSHFHFHPEFQLFPLKIIIIIVMGEVKLLFKLNHMKIMDYVSLIAFNRIPPCTRQFIEMITTATSFLASAFGINPFCQCVN